MILVRFFCTCGHGPLSVDGNEEAPIANPPCSITDDDCEGRPLAFCPNCDEPLPDFLQVGRRVPV